jgi:hypothetical protein
MSDDGSPFLKRSFDSLKPGGIERQLMAQRSFSIAPNSQIQVAFGHSRQHGFNDSRGDHARLVTPEMVIVRTHER